MSEPKPPEAPLPFSYIAHKGGRWGAIISPQHFSRAELREWLGDYMLKGFQIKAIADRAEHNAFLAPMQPCGGDEELPL